MSRQRSLKTFVSLASAIAVLALPAGAGEQTDGTGELARRSPFDVSPLGREYLRALQRYLRRTGYDRALG